MSQVDSQSIPESGRLIESVPVSQVDSQSISESGRLIESVPVSQVDSVNPRVR